MTTRRLITYLMVVISVGAILFVALSSGDDSGPDLSACKAAMQTQFAYGMAHPDAPEGTRPSACQGVSDTDMQRFASEIMSEYLGGG